MDACTLDQQSFLPITSPCRSAPTHCVCYYCAIMRGSDCATIVNPEGTAWPGAWDYNPKDKLHKDSEPQTTL